MSNRHLGRAKNIIASQKGPEPKDSGSGDSNGRRPAHSFERGRPEHSYEQGSPSHSRAGGEGRPAPREASIDKTDRRPVETRRDFAPTRRERPDPRERRQAPGRGKALLERFQAKRAAKREQRDERREARGSVGAQ